MKQPFLCRFWGHRYAPIENNIVLSDACLRCGEEEFQPRTAHWLHYRWLLLRNGWQAIFGRCCYCHRRFGRHNYDADHIPF